MKRLRLESLQRRSGGIGGVKKNGELWDWRSES